MIDEWYYIFYWSGISIGISGLLLVVSGYDPTFGTRITLTSASSLLIGLSAGGLAMTVRDMLSPVRATNKEEA